MRTPTTSPDELPTETTTRTSVSIQRQRCQMHVHSHEIMGDAWWARGGCSGRESEAWMCARDKER